jgi:P2X purinoceptor 4
MVNERKRFGGFIRQRYDALMASLDAREDTDKLFSYYTKQQVSFLDRKLGITFYTLQILIAAYIVGYMFIYQKGYLQYEAAKGATATHVLGDAVAVSSGKAKTRYFSTEELTYPGLENGNVFIATRQKVHKQSRGTCEDLSMPCTSNGDCTVGGNGVCTENGYCKERSWCDIEAKPEIYEVETDLMQIWTRSSIQYVKIAPEKVFSTEMKDPTPKRGINVFTVRELLMMCTPLPVRYEEIAELGAAIEVQFIWDCNVKEKDCKPVMKARRLDTIFDPDNIGFGFSYPEYLDDNSRLLNEVRGVRIFFKTSGSGRKVSVAATITKASMGASLFSIAQIIADLLMTRLFSLSRKYKARKYETTPDFSEHMEKVEERKKNQVTDSKIEEEERKVQEKEELWMRKLDEED